MVESQIHTYARTLVNTHTHIHSQPPEVALALGTPRQYLLLAAPLDRPAATIFGPMVSTQAAGAELEATVLPAAYALSLDGVTPGKLLAPRAPFQTLVNE